jgi:hypothetical protein
VKDAIPLFSLHVELLESKKEISTLPIVQGERAGEQLIRLIKFIKKNKLRTVKIGIILITLALAIIHFWPEEDFTGKAVPFFPSNDYPLIFFDDSINAVQII